jgi:hypothetical protein
MLTFRTQTHLLKVVFAGYVRHRSWLKRLISPSFPIKSPIRMSKPYLAC